MKLNTVLNELTQAITNSHNIYATHRLCLTGCKNLAHSFSTLFGCKTKSSQKWKILKYVWNVQIFHQQSRNEGIRWKKINIKSCLTVPSLPTRPCAFPLLVHWDTENKTPRYATNREAMMKYQPSPRTSLYCTCLEVEGTVVDRIKYAVSTM